MLTGWEWIVIGLVAIVIILWGPAKIPEFARALGRAKGEFDKATQEFSDAATETAQGTTHADEDVLFETAKRLGIVTEGKTRTQISAEISEKVKALAA